MLLVAAGFAGLVAWTLISGFDYYRLDPAARAFHPKHAQLRPSGPVGIRLGMLGLGCFFGIYLYAVRKRLKPLGRIGKTRNWLDIHVVLGVAAPVIITLHSSFKMQGLAGIAYWIMLAVMLSGIVGRYLYSQIPRSINAAEMSLQEMEALSAGLARQLDDQHVVPREELGPLLEPPAPAAVESMPLALALLAMLRQDLLRPFRVAAVRRRAMRSRLRRLVSLGGLRASGQRDLEQVVQLARRRSWLATKLAFLSKTQRVFHLWHVVHRPFSYSFAVLVAIHITVVVLMGYF